MILVFFGCATIKSKSQSGFFYAQYIYCAENDTNTAILELYPSGNFELVHQQNSKIYEDIRGKYTVVADSVRLKVDFRRVLFTEHNKIYFSTISLSKTAFAKKDTIFTLSFLLEKDTSFLLEKDIAFTFRPVFCLPKPFLPMIKYPDFIFYKKVGFYCLCRLKKV